MQTVFFKNEKENRELVGRVFEKEKKKILKYISEVEVHHIGGTSVPGALTKGDLDINVRVSEEEFKNTTEVLKKLYTVAQPENWTESFSSFKGVADGIDIGIQLSVIGAPEDTFVMFRDLLIDRADLLDEYNKLKQGFEGKSMQEYRKAKAAFCKKWLVSGI